MNVIRKIMMGLGGVVVVALVLALASPKTVHAVVSALVTVSNTPANRAIAQATPTLASQNVTLFCNSSLSSSNCEQVFTVDLRAILVDCASELAVDLLHLDRE